MISQGQSPEFESLSAKELDGKLQTFYSSIRQGDGTPYSNGTMVCIRYAIKRHLKMAPHNRKLDLVHDLEFVQSNRVLRRSQAYAVLGQTRNTENQSSQQHAILAKETNKEIQSSQQNAVLCRMRNKENQSSPQYAVLGKSRKTVSHSTPPSLPGKECTVSVLQGGGDAKGSVLQHPKPCFLTSLMQRITNQTILKEDYKKLYEGGVLGTCNPISLQRKVLVEVVQYFQIINRGDLRKLTKNSFHFLKDEESVTTMVMCSGCKHANGKIMVAIPDDPYCPVASLKLYLEKLHPLLNNFFQTPKNIAPLTDDHWYNRRVMGPERIWQMMPEISVAAGLSQIYTNKALKYAPILISVTTEQGDPLSQPVQPSDSAEIDLCVRGMEVTREEADPLSQPVQPSGEIDLSVRGMENHDLHTSAQQHHEDEYSERDNTIWVKPDCVCAEIHDKTGISNQVVGDRNTHFENISNKTDVHTCVVSDAAPTHENTNDQTDGVSIQFIPEIFQTETKMCGPPTQTGRSSMSVSECGPKDDEYFDVSRGCPAEHSSQIHAIPLGSSPENISYFPDAPLSPNYATCGTPTSPNSRIYDDFDSDINYKFSVLTSNQTPGSNRRQSTGLTSNQTPSSNRKQSTGLTINQTPASNRNQSTCLISSQTSASNRNQSTGLTINQTPASNRNQSTGLISSQTPASNRKQSTGLISSQTPASNRKQSTVLAIDQTPGSNMNKFSVLTSNQTPASNRRQSTGLTSNQIPASNRKQSTGLANNQTLGSNMNKNSVLTRNQTPRTNRKQSRGLSSNQIPEFNKNQNSIQGHNQQQRAAMGGNIHAEYPVHLKTVPKSQMHVKSSQPSITQEAEAQAQKDKLIEIEARIPKLYKTVTQTQVKITDQYQIHTKALENHQAPTTTQSSSQPQTQESAAENSEVSQPQTQESAVENSEVSTRVPVSATNISPPSFRQAQQLTITIDKENTKDIPMSPVLNAESPCVVIINKENNKDIPVSSILNGEGPLRVTINSENNTKDIPMSSILNGEGPHIVTINSENTRDIPMSSILNGEGSHIDTINNENTKDISRSLLLNAEVPYRVIKLTGKRTASTTDECGRPYKVLKLMTRRKSLYLKFKESCNPVSTSVDPATVVAITTMSSTSTTNTSVILGPGRSTLRSGDVTLGSEHVMESGSVISESGIVTLGSRSLSMESGRLTLGSRALDIESDHVTLGPEHVTLALDSVIERIGHVNQESCGGTMRTGHVTAMSGAGTMRTEHVTSELGNRTMKTGHVTSEFGDRTMRTGHVTSMLGDGPTRTGHVTSMLGDGTTRTGHVTSMLGDGTTSTGYVAAESGSMAFLTTRTASVFARPPAMITRPISTVRTPEIAEGSATLSNGSASMSSHVLGHPHPGRLHNRLSRLSSLARRPHQAEIRGPLSISVIDAVNHPGRLSEQLITEQEQSGMTSTRLYYMIHGLKRPLANG